jgi:putative ABC transport system substrate-binding protein
MAKCRSAASASGSPSPARPKRGVGQLRARQALAPSLGVEVRPINVRDAGEIERAMTAFARPVNGGLIVAGAAA